MQREAQRRVSEIGRKGLESKLRILDRSIRGKEKSSGMKFWADKNWMKMAKIDPDVGEICTEFHEEPVEILGDLDKWESANLNNKYKDESKFSKIDS
jgi:hypothetical protein